MVKSFSNWLLTIFDHCATSKMLSLPFFMLKFSQQTPCLTFFKTHWSNVFKLTFDHFWPLCNIKNTNFDIFYARKLKFSQQTPCQISFIKQWSNLFQINFWPFLTTLQHQKYKVCHFSCLRAEIFTTDPLPDFFHNTVIKFLSIWLLTCFDHCAT